MIAFAIRVMKAHIRIEVSYPRKCPGQVLEKATRRFAMAGAQKTVTIRHVDTVRLQPRLASLEVSFCQQAEAK